MKIKVNSTGAVEIETEEAPATTRLVIGVDADQGATVSDTSFEEALAAYNKAFSDFQRKHGFYTSREERDYEHHGDGWRHMKTYTAPDGANFYEVVQYPAQEYGLRVEYWSDDAVSTIAYL